MPFRPQTSVNLFLLLYRADRSTPLIHKGQPRGPGNDFIWNWGFFHTWSVGTTWVFPAVANPVSGLSCPALSSHPAPSELPTPLSWGCSVLPPSANGGEQGGPGSHLNACGGGASTCHADTCTPGILCKSSTDSRGSLAWPVRNFSLNRSVSGRSPFRYDPVAFILFISHGHD